MNILEKIQKQPKNIRKVILWLIIIALAGLLFAWWFKDSCRKVEDLQEKSFIEDIIQN